MHPDVAVIGGGIVGATVAADLAGRGIRVRLYERAEVAAAASGRNSGVVWRPWDPVLDALYLESLERYRSLPAELEAELPATAPERSFRLADVPAGILSIGWDADALQALTASRAATHPEFRPTYLDPDALRALEPGLAGGLAALRLDIGFPVGPAAATRAMAALARARGAEVLEGTEVRIARDGSRVAGVEGETGREPAGAVVVATGPWSPALIDPTGVWRPIRSFWGVVVELEFEGAPRHVLEEARIDAAIEPGAVPEDPAGSVGFSLVTAGGRSSLGSTFLSAQPDPAAFEARLRHGGAGYVPAIAATPTRGLRTCARPLALDGRPLVGPVPGVEGLFVAAGHGPWGISTGPASAAHVAALVAGAADPRSPLVREGTDSARFGTPPGVG